MGITPGTRCAGWVVPLSCFEFFYCSATFLEKDAVTAIGAPDVDVDLNFLFAPCALVGADHT